MEKLKALIVDDSVLYRKILSDVLKSFSDVEVVGSANSGRAALDKLSQEDVDFITLDFEMPGMNGIEVLSELKKRFPSIYTIMVSAHTIKGAETTLKALNAGAHDFIAKPDEATMAASIKSLKQQMKIIVNTLQTKKRLRSAKKTPVVQKNKTNLSEISQRMQAVRRNVRVEVVGIAISTGGPNALNDVIPALPANLRVPVIIVQHMPAMFTKALAKSLDDKSKVKVVEGEHGMSVEPGTVYIAPGGKQMKVVVGEKGKEIAVTDAPPENNCKPSADYMLRSLATVYKAGALGVIMTGMGGDGVKGLTIMKKFGSMIIAQDEASCVVYGMPMEAVKAGIVDTQIPLSLIADEIVKCVR